MHILLKKWHSTMSGNELGKRVQRSDPAFLAALIQLFGCRWVPGHPGHSIRRSEFKLREEETRVSSRIGANDPPATFRNQDSIHMGNPISDAKVGLPVWEYFVRDIWEQLKVAPEDPAR